MSISKEYELVGMQEISTVVAQVLREMRNYAAPGMNTKQLDDFGGKLLKKFGARSAPKKSYKFPGFTCISINNEIAHGVPSANKILREGDLINIDVSGELNGFWSDNGGSFILGKDLKNHQPLIDTSRKILYQAINQIKDGIPIAFIGRLIEDAARKADYRVIKNLAGHGIGRSLHEKPFEITNYYDPSKTELFETGSVVAIETFIATDSFIANTEADGWTLVGNRGGYVAQHEHTILVTDDKPIILTAMNGI